MKRHITTAGRKQSYRFPDDYLPYLAARASHAVLREFHALLPSRRLRVPEWRVLGALSAGGGYTVGALARATLFKQPTLPKLLDRLERKGLVRRVAGGMDLRHSMVEITKKGRGRIAPAIAQARRHEKKVLKGFRARDIRALKTLLRSLAAGFERKAG